MSRRPVVGGTWKCHPGRPIERTAEQLIAEQAQRAGQERNRAVRRDGFHMVVKAIDTAFGTHGRELGGPAQNQFELAMIEALEERARAHERGHSQRCS